MMSNELSHGWIHNNPYAAALGTAFAPVDSEQARSQLPGELDSSAPAWESAWIDLGGEG